MGARLPSGRTQRRITSACRSSPTGSEWPSPEPRAAACVMRSAAIWSAWKNWGKSDGDIQQNLRPHPPPEGCCVPCQEEGSQTSGCRKVTVGEPYRAPLYHIGTVQAIIERWLFSLSRRTRQWHHIPWPSCLHNTLLTPALPMLLRHG